MHHYGASPPGRIDTLGFSFEVDPDSVSDHGATVTVLDHGGSRERTVVRRKLPGGGFLSVAADRAWVEASLPKRHDPDDLTVAPTNVEALPVGPALESARELFRESAEYVEPVRSGRRFELCRIVRIDPVRDFDGVRHVPELLDGLAAVPRSSVHKVRRWADAERNRAETLRVGPLGWGGTLYDKHAETKGVADEGRLRFELRFHGEQLESARAKDNGYVMRVLADVTEEKVQAMTRRNFERLAFDREVVGKASVASAVFGCEWLPPRMQDRLWAYLTAPGVAARMHRNTALRYRKIAAELGVTLAAADEEMADVLVHLDFDRGEEVVRVA